MPAESGPLECRATPGATEPVRTFHARRGRLSALTRTRLETLLPRYAVWDGLWAGLPRGTAAARAQDAGASAAYRRVVLEVGCGHGGATLAYAAAHPRDVVVALDVHPPGVARMLAAAAAAGLDNLAVELGDAVAFLERRVPSRALHAVHLFFPDPWPKTRHHRRRFVSGHTLELLADRLTADGTVLVATDSPGYVAAIRGEVLRQGAFAVAGAGRPPWRPVTGYEAKALTAGRPVHDLRLVRSERATRIELA